LVFDPFQYATSAESVQTLGFDRIDENFLAAGTGEVDAYL